MEPTLSVTETLTDTVLELSCNIDDMTGEQLGFAMEQLLDGGALDVFCTPIFMKKSRPAVLFTVLCREEDRDRMVNLIFQHTTTIGIRMQTKERCTLARREDTVQTPFGRVRRKISEGYGVCRCKYEYEDMAEICRKNDITLRELQDLLDRQP